MFYNFYFIFLFCSSEQSSFKAQQSKWKSDAFCFSCQATGVALFDCSHCGFVQYCSDECRDKFQPDHENWCQNLSDVVNWFDYAREKFKNVYFVDK
jgi:hypothetical protein